MPASWAKAFWPTIALFRWIFIPVMFETRWLVGYSAFVCDRRLAAEVIAPRLQRHHDFLERRVAGPLAEAVDRALDLPGPSFDRGQAVGDAQPQIVVTVGTQHGLADVGHVFPQILEDVPILRGDRVADRVGNIDRRRAGVDRLLDDLAEKVELGPRRVFGREFDVRAVVDGPLDHLDGLPDDLVLGHLEFELAMDGARRQKDVDPRPIGILERLPGAVDVLFQAASQAADHRAIAELPGNLAHGLKVTGRRDREAGLDHVDPQLDKSPGDLELFGRVHAAAGRLLAVAQGRVEDRDLFPFFGRHGSNSRSGQTSDRGNAKASNKPATKKPRDHRSQGLYQSGMAAN